MELKKKRNL